jgi:hypothetical protein
VRGDWAVGAAYLPAPQVSLPPTLPAEDEKVISTPVRWDLTAGTVERLDTVTSRAATAVTNAGDVVFGAVVVRDGLLYTLPVPVEGGSPRSVAVSEDGTVFAGAVDTEAPDGGDPVAQPTVWHCR